MTFQISETWKVCNLFVSQSPQTVVKSPSMLAIETTELSKQFSSSSIHRWVTRRDGATVHAVQAVSLRVEPGQIFGLLGPNGAGKTTLIKMLCTLIIPAHGSARVNYLRQSSSRFLKTRFLDGNSY